MSKTVLAAVAVILVVAALMYFAMRGRATHSCEVCIEFDGRTHCSNARGPSVQEATRAAADTACAFLTSGMTETMRCSRTEPKSAKCQ